MRLLNSKPGSTYEHAYRLGDVTAGKWYYEFQGLQSASVIAGGSGYIVGDGTAPETGGILRIQGRHV
jgi:hypothetical protein